jgi:DNA-binding SARP family transcriptional activator
MKTNQPKLAIRTLGDFSLAVDAVPVTINWPDKATRLLFCSLLSPLDAAYSRERLCKALWGTPANELGIARLTLTLDHLQNALVSTIGFSPVSAGPDGISVRRAQVQCDARDFHEMAITGLSALAQGNPTLAHDCFRTAAALYRGPFLPGIAGRIVTATRDDLAQQYLMLTRQLRLRPALPDAPVGRRPAALWCPA